MRMKFNLAQVPTYVLIYLPTYILLTYFLLT